jgi:16S rRNA (cytosine967-C5)-methyltransferase
VKIKTSGSRPAAVSPARTAAFDILLRVERESSYASELLHAGAYSKLTHVDHALATELVMGVLRWKSVLDAKVSVASSQQISRLDVEVLTALRLAIYQVCFLTKIPARAAIHESVELVKRARKRSAAPFVNAVLRKVVANSTHSVEDDLHQVAGHSATALAASSAHPNWLVERWVQAYGVEGARNLCAHNQSTPATSIRLRHPEAEARLRAEGIELAPGAMLTGARRVQRGDVTATAAFRSGLCVIQDEASQLVAMLLGEGRKILDSCAAPGGKTLVLADRNPQALVCAAELHPHRARLLRRLAERGLGSDEVRGRRINVLAADARRLPFTSMFDRILVDVPCSGTGTLSRNPEIKWRLTEKDLGDLQSRQLDILRATVSHVARGGRLIYSTCSMEREENEDVISRVLEEDSSCRIVDCKVELQSLRQSGDIASVELDSLTRGPYLRTIPGVFPYDGFFAAILEKI